MISNWRNLLLTLALLLGVVVSMGRQAPVSPSSLIPDVQAARQLAPPDLKLEAMTVPFPQVVGRNAQGEIRWKGVFSQFLNHQIFGYGGPIHLLVGLNERQEITGIAVLQHQETPSFFQGLQAPWFLKQFSGKTLHDPLVPFQDIDGITHATVSVDAFCETVRHCLACANNPGSSSSPPPSANPFSRSWLCLFIALLTVFFRSRIPVPVSSFVVICSMGIFSTQFLSLSSIQTLAAGLKESRLPNGSLSLFLGSAILLMIWYPRGYCYGICPTGKLQEVLLWISRKFISPTLPEGTEPGHQELDSTPSLLGRSLLWSALLAAMVAPGFPLEKVEVFSALWNLNQGSFGLLLAGSLLIGSFFVPRWYCRYLCPLNPAFSDLEFFKNSVQQKAPPSKAPLDE